jgi:hypothetical protein
MYDIKLNETELGFIQRKYPRWFEKPQVFPYKVNLRCNNKKN